MIKVLRVTDGLRGQFDISRCVTAKSLVAACEKIIMCRMNTRMHSSMMRTSRLRIVQGGGGCCDHVPGGGRGTGVVTMSQVGGGRGAGVVTMSQVGWGEVDGCCDHVPGWGVGVVTMSWGDVGGCFDHVPGGGRGRVL